MNTTLVVDEDGILTFTEEILQETGWKEGDVLEFIDNGDSFIMRKVDESE
jgi:bifunctional DNA-binding transcriptional regulator/antitoxin component of YhaV-PrlF toxin-antitoxin module